MKGNSNNYFHSNSGYTVDPRTVNSATLVPEAAMYAYQSQLTPDQLAAMHQYVNYYNYAGYPGADGVAAGVTENPLEAVQRCHLHKKPDLNCKFCRKYKSAVHEMSRISQQQSQNMDEKRDALPMTNSSTYNLNTLLRNNILASEYYKSLVSMQTFQEIVQELIQYSDHAEPYCSTATRAPSTLFCCLYRFFTMRLSGKQMTQLLEHAKSPYPRCCGFLYLRFVLPSDELWNWFEPYLLDDEEFVVGANGRTSTIGEFATMLLLEDKYANTILPRLPTKFRNLHGPQLMQMPLHRKRRLSNMDMLHAFVEGKKVMALKDGNWTHAEITTVAGDDHGYPCIDVIFEDETSASLDIAYVKLENDKPHKNDDYVHASDDYDAMDAYRKRQRERAIAHGKSYCKRPTSYKASLSRITTNR
ncbi:Pre-mRNA-splicing factor 38 [Babesia duncani]|uniref:Pre-mRNA-splicing factor 38 n=1 Tax=Babesia duncani TaxID=323732 RepID=A0AAD9PKR2_9APIC|nr:Pre-mRNA-splicing factor 38 [Babesia duncani]